MKRKIQKVLSIILAQAMLLSSFSLTAYAEQAGNAEAAALNPGGEQSADGEEASERSSGNEESSAENFGNEEEFAEEAAEVGLADEEASEESVGSDADTTESTGLFGFAETILNAGEGDALTISVVRSGDTEKEASVVFKAVDISAEYGKDYTLSVAKGASGEETLSAAGVRPLLEEYGEIAASEEISVAEESDGADADASSAETASDAAGAGESGSVKSGPNESGSDSSASENDLTLTGGSALSNLYTLQTGAEAPSRDWREFSGNNASDEEQEAINALGAGWDDTKEGLQALSGVTARLVFAPGEEKKEIKVRVKEDQSAESDEVVVFCLQDAEGAGIGDAYSGYLNIADNDAKEEMTWAVKESTLTVSSGQDTAKVTIVRKSGTEQIGFVSAGTKEADAKADVDYEKTFKELFFAPGVKEVSFEVPIIGERARESHFWIGVRDAGAAAREDSACFVTIEKDPERGTKASVLTEAESGAALPAQSAGNGAALPEGSASLSAAGAADEELPRLGDLNSDTKYKEFSVKAYLDGWEFETKKEIAKNIDLSAAKNINLNINISGVQIYKSLGSIIDDFEYSYWKSYTLYIVDSSTGNAIKTLDDNTYHSDRFNKDINYGVEESLRYCRDAAIWLGVSVPETGWGWTSAVTAAVKGSVTYDASGFIINPDLDHMAEYVERIYTGKDEYENGNTILFPTPTFAKGKGVSYTHQNVNCEELAFRVGETVSLSVWGGGTQNSQGVAADASTLNFRGLKLVKFGGNNELSEFITTSDSFTFDANFRNKYKSYENNGRYMLVAIYELKGGQAVEFINDYAAVDGKGDVKGVFEGIPSRYTLYATKLDTIRATVKANAGYGVQKMILQRPNGAMYSGSKKWTKWSTEKDNSGSDNPAVLAAPINYRGQMYTNAAMTSWGMRDYCRVVVYYGDPVSSITLTPSPQSVTEGTDSLIMFLDGPGGKDDPSLSVTIPSGGGLKVDKTQIGKPYRFGSIPIPGYHTYWEDGTLDKDGDGQSDIRIPGYEPFANTYGDQFMYVQQIPMENKIYYNYVLDDMVPEQIYSRSLRGYLIITDELLLTGKAVERGVNGIKVYVSGGEDGQEVLTKNGTYSKNVDARDGYYELASNDEFQYYDLYNYNVTFIGQTDMGPIAAMYSQNPSKLGYVYINAAAEVDVSDAKLLVEEKSGGSAAYATVDTSATTAGYYMMPGGDRNFRLSLKARRSQVYFSKVLLTFTNPDGKEISIDGTEDENHNGIYSFDFNPKNKGIQAGARAKVTFYAGDRQFLSRDTGLKVADSVGTVRILNSLSGTNSALGINSAAANGANSVTANGANSTSDSIGANSAVANGAYGANSAYSAYSANGASASPGAGVVESVADLIGSVGHDIDLEWTGEFDLSGDGTDEVFDDHAERVIRVGLGKNVQGAEKEMLMEAARTAAKAHDAAGEAAEKASKLFNRMSWAAEKDRASLKKAFDEARSDLERKNTLARRAQSAFDKKLEAIQREEKDRTTLGDSMPMDLGYSFLMTFGFESESGKWYFKELMLTTDLAAQSAVTMNYATPVGVTIGVGTRLKADGSSTIVVEERADLNEAQKKEKRYYITEENKDGFNILAAAGSGEDRLLDKFGSLNMAPSISVTGAAGVAGDMARVEVDGRAEMGMVYGQEESGGSCVMSARVKVSAIGYSASDELANGTVSLGGASALSAGSLIQALGGKQDSLLYAPIDILKPEDLRYLEDAEWYGEAKATAAENAELPKLGSVDEGGLAYYDEEALADRVAPDADYSLAALGNGRLAAVFLNAPRERLQDADNAKAAYYTFYNGESWEAPVLLENDGTLDQYPRIYALEDGEALILWSSVNKEYQHTADKLERQNALDLHGIFVNAAGSLKGEVMEITKTTKDESAAAGEPELSDFAADRAFGVSVSGDRLIVMYEKRAYEASQTGATVGDMLYPVSSLMVSRAYDLKAGKWAEGSETLKSLPGLAALGAERAEERLKSYNENVYGQRFHEYLPKVMLQEDLDETGYYREGGAGTTAIALAAPEKAMLLESDAATCTDADKPLGVYAFTVDTDGSLYTLYDRELYLATYDFEQDSFSAPIILTGYTVNGETNAVTRPENKNPRFVSTENGLYLLWLRDGDVVGMNVSHLLKSEALLVKEGTLGEISYYYVDKTPWSESTKALYEVPRSLVSGRRTEGAEGSEGKLAGDIQSFDAESDGRHIYVIWPEAAKEKPENLENGLNDIQMWGMRAEANEGGLLNITKPVQITSFYSQKYEDVAFGVTEKGLIGIASKLNSRLITASEAREIHKDSYNEATFVPYGIWDEEGAVPVAFRVNPEGSARIKNEGFANAAAGGSAVFSFEVFNDGFGDLAGVSVCATDSNGNGILREYVPGDGENDGYERLVSEISLDGLRGGETTVINGVLPVGEAEQKPEVSVTLKNKNGESKTISFNAELASDISVTDMQVRSTGERNRYTVSGTVRNDGRARAAAGMVTLAARVEGKDRKLAEIAYPALIPGDAYAFETELRVLDRDFAEVTASADDLLTEELCLYASYIGRTGKLELPVYETVSHPEADTEYSFISRSISREKLKELGYVSGVKVYAVKAVEDNDGNLIGGEVVSEGKSRLTLEVGEQVDIQAELTTDSPKKGGQVIKDKDGKILRETTGTEGLAWHYEFNSNALAEVSSDGMLKALNKGSGKLRIIVYPNEGAYQAENVAGEDLIEIEKNTDEGTYNGTYQPTSSGEEESGINSLPAAAIRSFELEVEIVDKGTRVNGDEDSYDLEDKNGIRYRYISGSAAAVCGLAEPAEGEKPVTKISIPASVKNKADNKIYNVTRIDPHAFKANADLVSVTIGKNVTQIGTAAFYGCGKLSTVSFGAGLLEIGSAAFKDCAALKSVSLPGKLETIGAEAFMNCAALRSVTLPAKLKTIGGSAFMNCVSLKAITLPAALTGLGEKAFYGCSALKTITIRSESLTASSIGTDAFAGVSPEAKYSLTVKNADQKSELNRALTDEGESFTDNKLLYQISSAENRTLTVTGLNDAVKGKLTSLSIPASVSFKSFKYAVTAVADSAFAGNTKLTNITLPKTIVSIGEKAFADCAALKSAVIPESVKTLGAEAYSGCGKLTAVTFLAKDAANPVTIGEGAFDGVPDTAVFKYGYKNETAIRSLGAQIIDAGESFTDKNGLRYELLNPKYKPCFLKGTENADVTSVTIPDTAEYRGLKFNVITVEDGAFAYHQKLKRVVVGKNVDTIGPDAFIGCAALTAVTLKTGKVNGEEKGLRLLQSSAFRDCTALTAITLPKTLSGIGNDAFRGCSALKAITLPKALSAIGSSAFKDCAALKTITLQCPSLGTVGQSAFAGINGNAVFKLSVQKDKKEAITALLTEAGVDAKKIR